MKGAWSIWDWETECRAGGWKEDQGGWELGCVDTVESLHWITVQRIVSFGPASESIWQRTSSTPFSIPSLLNQPAAGWRKERDGSQTMKDFIDRATFYCFLWRTHKREREREREDRKRKRKKGWARQTQGDGENEIREKGKTWTERHKQVGDNGWRRSYTTLNPLHGKGGEDKV